MVSTLILSHGELAHELVTAAGTVAGELRGFEALTFGWRDDLEEVRRRVAEAVTRLDQGAGVLILTDMYGNTPSNVALGFVEAGKVEMVAGVNLPMVVRLACLTSSQSAMTLAEIAGWIREKGRRAICGGPQA